MRPKRVIGAKVLGATRSNLAVAAAVQMRYRCILWMPHADPSRKLKRAAEAEAGAAAEVATVASAKKARAEKMEARTERMEAGAEKVEADGHEAKPKKDKAKKVKMEAGKGEAGAEYAGADVPIMAKMTEAGQNISVLRDSLLRRRQT